MERLPKRFTDRVGRCLKSYQAIAQSHRDKDVSEADTVTVVKDMLADIFGFDKYNEVTSEHQIRGTFCDLAIRIDGKVQFLIEVKGAALSLSDAHLRQAVNYGANHGIEWIILTNGSEWRLHRVVFGQPITVEDVASFMIQDLSANKDEDLQLLFLIAREGMADNVISSYHQRLQLVNKFTIAQILLSEQIVATARRELRRLFPDIKVRPEQVEEIIRNEVMKREVVEGDRAKEAGTRLKRAANKLARAAQRAIDGSKQAQGFEADADQAEAVASAK